MGCQLCDKEFGIEDSAKLSNELVEDDYVTTIVGLSVCKSCREKVILHFREIVK